MFDYRTQSKSIERLQFDWVRLTTLGFIHTYSIIVEYDIKGKYPKKYSIVDKVGREKRLARKSCFV